MPVRIRLARRGSKKRPYYWIVAANSESPRDGRFIEKLGIYNPVVDPAEVSINSDRVNYWLQQGAQPTETVNSLIRKEGIREGVKAS
jgi:small subunit ribosomal protein S16